MSSAPINESSRLAGAECCRPSKGKPFGIFVTAGPQWLAATCMSATGVDIASSYITPALWEALFLMGVAPARAPLTGFSKDLATLHHHNLGPLARLMPGQGMAMLNKESPC